MDVDELAFTHLIGHIEECLEIEVATVFTLSDHELIRCFQCKLRELGSDVEKINSTRLKERILKALPALTAHVESREARLVSRQEIGGILTEAKRKDSVQKHKKIYLFYSIKSLTK